MLFVDHWRCTNLFENWWLISGCDEHVVVKILSYANSAVTRLRICWFCSVSFKKESKLCPHTYSDTPTRRMSQPQCQTRSCSTKSALWALANRITIRLPGDLFQWCWLTAAAQPVERKQWWRQKPWNNASLYFTDIHKMSSAGYRLEYDFRIWLRRQCYISTQVKNLHFSKITKDILIAY